MATAFVIVDGIATDVDDINDAVPGTYEVEIKDDTSADLFKEVALEVFHDNIGIAVLDDFEISVVDETGEPFDGQTDDPDVRDNFDLLSMGDFCGRRDEGDLPYKSGPAAVS